MTDPSTSLDPSRSGPGEARLRQRQRRQAAYFAVAALIGLLIGLSTSLFDQGDGNLFAGGSDRLALDPLVAIGIAILLLLGFLVLPLSGFSQIDELKREQNLIGYTGGCSAVLAGYPVWAVLNAGDLAPAPHAFGVWLIGFAGMGGSFLYARWRL
jgi:hypothetical protein